MYEQFITVVLEFLRSGQRVKVQLPGHMAESIARDGFQPVFGARVLAVQGSSRPHP